MVNQGDDMQKEIRDLTVFLLRVDKRPNAQTKRLSRTCKPAAFFLSVSLCAPLPFLSVAHLLSMELGQFLLVLGGGGTLVLLAFQQVLHLLPVVGPQLLQCSPLIRLKLGLSLAERPQLLLKISTHLLHLLETTRHVLFCAAAAACWRFQAHQKRWGWGIPTFEYFIGVK